MKKTLYIVFSVVLFFVLLLAITNDLNPVGTVLQQWISLLPVLIIPLFLNGRLIKRILIFIPLASLFSFLGSKWADYSDFGGFIFIYYCFFILVGIVISHFILKYLNSVDTRISSTILVTLIIGVSIIGVFFVRSGIAEYRQLVQEFKTVCTTTGSIYGGCEDSNYMRFFPPNNHITF